MPLIVKIIDNKLRFSGDTFTYKESIKALGKARWESVSKEWVLSANGFTIESIRERFPAAEIFAEEISANFSGDISGDLVLEDKPLELYRSNLNNSSNENTNREISREEISREEIRDGASFGGASVLELSQNISITLSRIFPGEVKVYGSISSLKILSNKRAYFELTDLEKKDTSISCVIWESDFGFISKQLKDSGLSLENELPILIKGQIRLNEKRAQVSLSIKGLIPEYTIGKLLAEREKTNTRLKKENLFDLNKKLPFPLLPKRIGILTSKGGTVINDMLASLEVCGFGFQIFWYPVRVQGDGAVSEICNGIKYFSKLNEIDLILIFRGGGSATELGLFNTYEIAKCICQSSKPVLSAIGHEYDQTSTQDVSYKFFGVPKDLGRFLSDIIIERRQTVKDNSIIIRDYSQRMIAEIRESFLRTSEKICTNADKVLSLFKSRLLLCGTSLIERTCSTLLLAESKLKNSSTISANVNRLINSYEEKLDEKSVFLEAISPKTQLARGFSLLRSLEDNSYITSSKKLKSGDNIFIELKDGEVLTEIKSIKETNNA